MIRSSLLPYWYRVLNCCLLPANAGSSMNPAGIIFSRRPRQTPRRRVDFFSTAATTSSSSSEIPPIIWTTHRLNKEQILKVDKIFHKILWLDIFESQILTELVNVKLGIVLTKKQRKQLQARMTALDNEDEEDNSASVVQVEEEVKPVLMDVKLTGYDAKAKIKVIKEVRAALELGLKEAKELVESVPVPLQKGMQPEAATALKEKLEAAGATVELTEV